MFGRQNSRAHRAERIAGQAWDQLVSAVDNAGSGTRSATRSAVRRATDAVDSASGRVGSGAKEARVRAGRAYDALAGRKPAKPWGAFAAAALAGAAIAWVAVLVGRQLVARGDELALERSLADDAFEHEHTPQ